VIEEHLSQLRAIGRVLVRSPDADRAAALLDGRVDRRDGDRFLVRHPDPAELNQLLVSGGIRVSEKSDGNFDVDSVRPLGTRYCL